MRRALKRLEIALLLLFLLPALALLAINAVDESLDPAAAAFGMPRAPAVADAQNGYFGLLALAAPPGVDAVAFARDWLEEARAAAREQRPENHPPEPAPVAGACDPAQVDCLDAALADPAATATLLGTQAETLARYERLLGYARFEEVLDYPLRPDSHFPPYMALAHAQRVYLLHLAQAAGQGLAALAADGLARDIAFQRAMLAGSRTLMGRMIAQRALWNDLMLLDSMMTHHAEALRPELLRLRGVLGQLEAAARNGGSLLEFEFALGRGQLLDPLGTLQDVPPPGWFERNAVRLFYQPNATLNAAWRELQAAIAAADAPPAELRARHASLQAREPRFWEYAYNPIGRILLASGRPDISGYLLRIHDTDALMRMVALRLEYIVRAVPAHDAGGFLAVAPARFHDPYTGTPFRWEEARMRLSFEAQGDNIERFARGVEGRRVYIGF